MNSRDPILLALIALASSSCTERPLTAPTPGMRPVSRPLASSVSPDGNEILVSDDDGVWRLVVSENRIYAPSGLVIQMTVAQTDAIGGAFRSVVSSDSVSNDASVALCDPYCFAEELRGSSSSAQRGVDHWTSLARLATYARPDGALRLSGPSVASVWLDGTNVCVEIARHVYARQNLYRPKRNPARKVVTLLASFVANQTLDLTPQGQAALAVWGLIEFDLAVSETLHEAIQLGFLTGMWNDYNCRSRPIYIGQVWRNVKRPGTGYHCADEYDNIVVAGESITVKVTECFWAVM
jgi:hypothetical protein